MAKIITDKVTWVGKIDWELVYFHGHELSTYKGSSSGAGQKDRTDRYLLETL